ncbi:MAG: hypothetical protein KTR24_00165 [Saprospiraceae bacterium]|nr:hypothetical protein [Saprospiraceae bacterium]
MTRRFSYCSFLLLMCLGVLLFWGNACTKIEFTEDQSVRLEFSLDTLSFDTVFTSVGSATRSFRVRNTEEKFVRISNIKLEQSETFFRMNVDGIPGNVATDIEIPPNDSIWIFVEVTVDPDQPTSVSPFVINQRISFETNGNRQEVVLEAWGQNANYLPNRFAAGEQRLISCDLNTWTWDDPRPYVIYGVLVIDSCTLSLPPGTRVHIHGGFGQLPDGSRYSDGILFFLKNARLEAQGTVDNPVIFQGDRLEDSFDDVGGQWGRIHFDNLSRGNKMNHVIIKNSIIGVYVDSLADLTVTNSQIFNTSSSAMVGYRANVVAENTLLHSSGGNNLTVILGGSYNFNYCTLDNIGTSTEALRASNFTCLDDPQVCDRPVAAPLALNFVNSIITGSSRDEISFVNGVPDEPEFFRYNFDHCIVKVDELLEPGAYPDFFDHCTNCISDENRSILFEDESNGDYHLDSLSIAEEMATPLFSVSRDLEENLRDAQQPDIGCYEYVYD